MRRSSILLATILLSVIAVLIHSYSGSALSSTTGDIEGTVKVDSYYKEPVVGADVILELNGTEINRTTTDTQGRFNFTNLEPGPYVVIVEYHSEEKWTTVHVNSNETEELDIRIYIGASGDDDDAEDSGMVGFTLCPIVLIIGILFFIVIVIIIILVWNNYSKITSKKLMDHETRQRILEYLNTNPGGHLRGIKEDLGLPMGVLTHHIYKMEEEEVIKSRMEGKYRRFYPYNHKIVKGPLLTGTQKKIYEIIKSSPGCNPPDITDKLGISRKTVYYHVQELEAKGVLRVNRDEKQFKCYVLQET